MRLDYSFIIPVFNRPNEIRELLQSMLRLNFKRGFEVVIVEDGSAVPSDRVVAEFKDKLQISYYFKANSGPGNSRNFGMQRAMGNYFLILDSDVVLPADYLKEVDGFLVKNHCDCFGGPDAAHENFTAIQKAIDYSMTAVLTTGGIRGRTKAINKFQPRSFNMGISKKAFEATGGFGEIHPGEDPDLSLRLEQAGFRTCLIPRARVFHKRRIEWEKFYRQVHKFGLVRPILNQWHPGSAKITYWFPGFFTLGLLVSILLLTLGYWWFFGIYMLYFLIILADAIWKYKSLKIGFLAVFAVLVQFWGYGLGFLESTWKLQVLKKDPRKEFPNLFFKNG